MYLSGMAYSKGPKNGINYYDVQPRYKGDVIQFKDEKGRVRKNNHITIPKNRQFNPFSYDHIMKLIGISFRLFMFGLAAWALIFVVTVGKAW